MARILIVDDDESERVLIQAVLTRAGHDAFLASSGEEALRSFLRDQPDIVLTDVHMPYGDGLELIGAITGLRADVPVIVISGSGGPSTLGAAESVGARRALPKPIDPARLLSAIDEVLAEAA